MAHTKPNILIAGGGFAAPVCRVYFENGLAQIYLAKLPGRGALLHVERSSPRG
jgi:hypothetical protein